MTQGRQTTTYSYNSQNELLSETGPSGTTSYTYDALDNQVSATVNGAQSDFVIDPLAISTSATGPLSSIAQVYTSNGTVSATYDYGNGLATLNSNGSTYYYGSDADGNVTDLSGPGGRATESYLYDPFGTVIASAGYVSNPFQFLGILGATVLSDDSLFLRARVYYPATGRFGSLDPSGIVGGTNRYAYVDNGSTYLLDPTGDEATRYATSSPRNAGLVTIDELIPPAEIPITGQKVPTSKASNPNFNLEGSAYDKIKPYAGPIVEGATQLVQAKTLGQTAKAIAKIPLVATNPLAVVPPYGALIAAMIARVHSTDPNDIVGPLGSGQQAFIAKSAVDAYTINFANATIATAPTQQIAITEQLDRNLDWRTFRLTGFSFDNQTTTLSGSQAFYSVLLDYSATKGYDVQVIAGVNVATGLVTWTFQTIDPATGQAPLNPQLGLLPVDDSTQDGEGFVSYTVQAKSTVQTGEIVLAQATVVFDTNAPIDTATITNTIDAVAPTSEVQAIPAEEATPSFEVSWSGTDDPAGSGIASYTILVSDDGATPMVWLDDTTRTNAIFSGNAGHTYAFSSIATDNAGNVESVHATPDAETSVACYCRGTLILTKHGQMPVESLAIGNLVLTSDGTMEPIRWIGRRSYDGRFIAGDHLMLPVTIRAGAFSDGVPSRDLTVSPGHAMWLNGQLVPAWRLVNGRSIIQAVAVERVEYFHVELHRHALLLAEGALAESYLDEGDFRGQFQNAAEFQALYPAAAPMPALQPRLEDGWALQRIQERLADRAGLSPSVEPAGTLRGFVDWTDPDRICGWAQDCDSPEEPVALEISVRGMPVVCVLANGWRADLRRAGLGSLCHAFDVLLPIRLEGTVVVRRVTDGAVLRKADTVGLCAA